MTWLSLVELSPRRACKRYGPVAAQCRDLPALVGEGQKTLVLQRRHLRRALQQALPAGHQPLTIVAEDPRQRRIEKAARAHQRLTSSGVDVPDPGLTAERFLVWSSPVARPEGFEPLELCVVYLVQAADIPQAVRELWGTLFLFAARDVPGAPLKRLEVAVLLTPDSPEARAAVREVIAPKSGEQGWLPLPGEQLKEASLLEIDRSLVRHTLPQYLRAVEQRLDIRLPRTRRSELCGGLDAGAMSSDLQELDGPERFLVQTLLGPPTALALEPPPRSLRDLPALLSRLGFGLLEERRLGRRVERLESSVRLRLEWSREVELSLLPDDALRHTLEEHLDLLQQLTTVTAEADLYAAERSREYSAVTGLSPTDLDAGLATPPLDVLRTLEDWWADSSRRLSRSDSALAMNGGAANVGAAGAGMESDGASDAGSAAGVSPAGREVVLREGVGVLLRTHPEVFYGVTGQVERALLVDLQRCLASGGAFAGVDALLERSRVRLDQKLVVVEGHLPRMLLPGLSTLRGICRDGIVLRERVRMAQVHASYLLRRVVDEIDRRLPGLDYGLATGAAHHCSLSELELAVDLSGRSLVSRVAFRALGRARLDLARRAQDPYPFELSPVLRERTLAFRRGLWELPLLLLRPEGVRYRGRVMDTIPTVARSLGLALRPELGPSSEAEA